MKIFDFELNSAEMDQMRALDKGKGMHDPDAPGVEEMLSIKTVPSFLILKFCPVHFFKVFSRINFRITMLNRPIRNCIEHRN